MKISNTINTAIITAVVGMLSPFVKNLSPSTLITALQEYDNDKPSESGNLKASYTISEAAKLLKVSRPTIYRMFEDGSLKKLKIRGATRLRSQDIENILMPD